MKVDLTTCVNGQKLKTRNGRIGVYRGIDLDLIPYEHRVFIDGIDQGYTHSGHYFANESIAELDIVEVIPMDQPESTALSEPPREKPPLGLRPRKIAAESRCLEIIEACKRYLNEGRAPKQEWIQELVDITDYLNSL